MGSLEIPCIKFIYPPTQQQQQPGSLVDLLAYAWPQVKNKKGIHSLIRGVEYSIFDKSIAFSHPFKTKFLYIFTLSKKKFYLAYPEKL